MNINPRDWFGGGDPTGRSPSGSGPGPSYPPISWPDEHKFVPAPESNNSLGKIPYAAAPFIAEAETQGHAQLAECRKKTTKFTSKALELTDRADHQTGIRDGIVKLLEAAREHLTFANKVLTPYVRHSGHGWIWMYALVWVLLLIGDIAGGALVLTKAGEDPRLAVLFMTSIGTAAITSAKIAEDCRQRSLWLEVQEKLPEDPNEKRLVEQTFKYGASAYRFLLKMVLFVGIAITGMGVGTLTIRSSVDGFGMALGFGFWSALIVAGSAVNAWYHIDPAHTRIKNYERDVLKYERRATKANTKAVDQRAANLSGIAEMLQEHEGIAHALKFEAIRKACEVLAANPQLVGHGTDGLPGILRIKLTWEDKFDQLRDEFQIPRYYNDRPFPTPAAALDSADNEQSDADSPDGIGEVDPVRPDHRTRLGLVPGLIDLNGTSDFERINDLPMPPATVADSDGDESPESDDATADVGEGDDDGYAAAGVFS